MSERFPPPGFIQTPSAVEGFTIYAPSQEEAHRHQEIVDFTCPNCGADRAYSIEDGSLRCVACGYVEELETKVVGRGAQEFEFKIDTLQYAGHGWGVERKELQCQNCGAVTTQPQDSLTHTCPFCGSMKIIHRKAPQDILRPRFLVPMKIKEEQCHSATREWLGSSWMVPDQLQEQAVLDQFAPLFLPFWTFDADISASWKAEVGKRVTRGSGKNRRTTTVWKWESGEVKLNIDDLIISGTTRVSEVLLNRMKDYSTDDLVSYDPKYLAGMQAQAYERDLETAWEMGRGEMRERTKTACRDQASTDKIRNFSMKMDFSNEAWRYILLPVYVSAYQYQDKTYQVLVNGQTAAVAGQRPVNWPKVLMVAALMLIPGTCGLLTGGVGILMESIVGEENTVVTILQLIGYGGFMVFSAAVGWIIRTISKAMSFDDA